ncbi:MAG: sigma-70 family RNA polymerase sigma factor [Chloroflexi bacterium]|nr:sigma-70 family RNA polymerase sigma factor [Chloroflexota bacterium]
MTDETRSGSLRVASAADDADRQVLVDVGEGRLEALEALYDRYRAMAYAIALRITADPTLAEDVVQDAFLGVWRHADRYVEGRGSVKTWLLSIVHHRAIDAVRRRRPARELPDPELPSPPQLVVADVWPEVAGRLDAIEVRAAMAVLSDVQREAIELAYWGGLSQTEIAERTGAPLGTVKSRMRLGLLVLRRALTGDAGDGHDLAEGRP